MRENGTEAHKLYNNYADKTKHAVPRSCKTMYIIKDKVNEVIDTLASHNQTIYIPQGPTHAHSYCSCIHIGGRAVYIMCCMQRVEED